MLMARENQKEHICDGTASPPPLDIEAQQSAVDYVGLCDRLIACCESMTLNPIKTGVQT